jgi:TP53 regulating kinase and related kinases
MAQRDELIFLGAEAEVRRSTYLGLPSVSKRRVAKAYRHRELDARIRKERTRAEAQLLSEARSAGVAVPRVLDVDVGEATITLEAIEGETLRARIERRPAEAKELCREFGALVARLHAAGLVHGDLTTSNVLVGEAGLVLVDFGLAQRSSELEDRGVDLHLVERTFESSHAGAPQLFDGFLEGYRSGLPAADEVAARMQEIKERGRYA